MLQKYAMTESDLMDLKIETQKMDNPGELDNPVKPSLADDLLILDH